ncbi:MAG: NAD(+) synthase, partial [Rikenellaceae bacterium]
MRNYGLFRVATASPKVKIGDCAYNCDESYKLLSQAAEEGAEVVVFPELSITGYTCGDLFLQPHLLNYAQEALLCLVERSRDIKSVGVVGVPLMVESRLYNCALFFCGGEILGAVPKTYIPNYSEFYEARWFASANSIGEGATINIGNHSVEIATNLIFKINGVDCACEICEDLWVPCPPSSALSQRAHVILNLSASPEVVGKHEYLTSLIEQQSARCMSAYVYSSAGFGESSTDLVFAGKGVIAENGRILAQMDRFSLESEIIVADIDIELLKNHRLRSSTFHAYSNNKFITKEVTFEPSKCDTAVRRFDRTPFVPSDLALRQQRCQEIFLIQSSGLAQRVSHTRCKCAVIGISGGLDSTLALLVTVQTFDRLGLDRKGIIGVTMPGFGTTGRTYNNAVDLIKELGVTLREISIKEACLQHFSDIGLSEDDRSVSYENSQARERTQILMDISNMEGGLVIGTGDLSEMALGWATYNGDHMSMYGVNASVPKTLVRYLVSWVADEKSTPRVAEILRDIVATPVSPELLPADEQGDIAQKTEDLVGPYELHDFFLYHFVRSSFSPSKIAFMAIQAFEGDYDKETILKWLRVFIHRFFTQQFKRSATPDAPKVGSVSLSP